MSRWLRGPWGRVALAGLFVGVYLTTALIPPIGAVFSGTTFNGSSMALGSLTQPGSVSCRWASATSLTLNWSNTNGTVATGHSIERSNTSGSGFAAIGTTTPASVVTYTDTSPSPPTLRYYRLTATLGTWASPYTTETVSNTCAATIEPFAGGGATSACSYTGPATGLAMSFPSTASPGVPAASAALATDSVGNLYVADTNNNCVRKIDTAGNVTPVAGGGATTTCGTTTSTAVKLNAPQGVTVDSSGNVYIADTGANCIREVSGTTVTKVAGGGATTTCGTTTAANVSLASPTGIAVDSSGNLYIGDNGHLCLRKIATGGTVTAAAGTGSGGACPSTGTAATSTPLRMIDQVTVDTAGAVYVADGYNSCLYKISGGTTTRLAGISSGTQASCAYTGDPSTVSYVSAYLSGVAVDTTGKVYFAIGQDGDPMNRACIIRVSASTAVQTAGQNGTGNTGNDGPAIAANLTTPASIAISPTGDLFILDTTAATIRRVITP